jgi:hypothetical protein
MAVICLCLAYVGLLVLVVRYYHLLRRWDDESDARAVKEQEEATLRKASFDAVSGTVSDFPPVFLIRHKDGVFVTEVLLSEDEQIPGNTASKPSVKMDAPSGRMKQSIGFSVN